MDCCCLRHRHGNAVVLVVLEDADPALLSHQSNTGSRRGAIRAPWPDGQRPMQPVPQCGPKNLCKDTANASEWRNIE